MAIEFFPLPPGHFGWRNENRSGSVARVRRYRYGGWAIGKQRRAQAADKLDRWFGPLTPQSCLTGPDGRDCAGARPEPAGNGFAPCLWSPFESTETNLPAPLSGQSESEGSLLTLG